MISGFIYVLEGEDGRFTKIGKTTNLARREQFLKIQLPFKVRVTHFIKTDDIDFFEGWFHTFLADYRVNGEWFTLPPEKLDWVKSFSSWTHAEHNADLVAIIESAFSNDTNEVFL